MIIGDVGLGLKETGSRTIYRARATEARLDFSNVFAEAAKTGVSGSTAERPCDASFGTYRE